MTYTEYLAQNGATESEIKKTKTETQNRMVAQNPKDYKIVNGELTYIGGTPPCKKCGTYCEGDCNV